ncbi:hypothetical protein [Paenibacillus sp. RC67]|uniref:hypothetical protein n=1 Tax=Paenibacillus sp. RC67 TaxID=3039392 RepID=UPI0024AD5845|nr:hypothetical protein [Paenibacillus sp. RC67]
MPDCERTFFVGAISKEEQEQYAIEPIPLEDLSYLEKNEYVALVTSPFMLPYVHRILPHKMIALLERNQEEESSGFHTKFNALLAAQAQLIGSNSEKVYLEQCFRHENVLYLPNEAQETKVWEEAVRALNRDEPTVPWKHLQWESRATYYRKLHKQWGEHETVCYLLASYLYLLEQPSAKHFLAVSFEQMMLKDHPDCLRSHFRFFSAIEAQAGNLDHAIRIYAITAFNEEEKRSVQTLYELLDKGKLDFIQAEIFRLNDDFHSAIRTLQQASGDSDADHFILSDYLLAFRWEEALRLLDRIGVPADERHLADMLRGTIQLIRGGRHKAVQSFLRGAVSDWRALNSIAEVEQWDQATRSVLGGLYDDSRADSQNDG